MSTSSTEPLETFSLFHELPPEIRLEILGHCSQNDLVCFSLTGPVMRSLVAPLIPSKPQLTWVDQLEPATQPPAKCISLPGEHSRYNRDCKGPRGNDVSYDHRCHRLRRHVYKNARSCYQCPAYPADHPTCQIPGCKRHCTCISCPLFFRLRGWMGERKYCSRCNQFTTRTRKNKNRCTHGVAKVRKAPNNHWSRKKGLSYGNRWWRRWGTHGIDQEAYQPCATQRVNARIV